MSLAKMVCCSAMSCVPHLVRGKVQVRVRVRGRGRGTSGVTWRYMVGSMRPKGWSPWYRSRGLPG